MPKAPHPAHFRMCFIGKVMLEKLIARMLQRACPAMKLETISREKDEVDTDRDLEDLLQQEFDLIALPLSLRNYGTLHMLESANAICLPTRFFLISHTEADAEALTQVFDYFSSQFYIDDVKRYLAPSRRERSPEKVDAAFDRILQTANCFKVPAGLGLPTRFSTLEDYRRRCQRTC